MGLQSGKVEGTDGRAEGRNAQMQANIDFYEPPVRVRQRLLDCINDQGNPDRLLIIEVKPTDFVHASKRDVVFLRVGDENRRLTLAQRQELLFDKGQASWEARVAEGLTTEDLDKEIAASYQAAAHAPDLDRLLHV